MTFLLYALLMVMKQKFNAELDVYNVGYRTQSMALQSNEAIRWFYSQWDNFKRDIFYAPIERASLNSEQMLLSLTLARI